MSLEQTMAQTSTKTIANFAHNGRFLNTKRHVNSFASPTYWRFQLIVGHATPDSFKKKRQNPLENYSAEGAYKPF